MAFDAEKLDDFLNRISLDLVMISPDNLVEVGEVLSQMDGLRAAFAPLDSPLPGEIIDLLVEGLTALIRGAAAEPGQVVELLGRGLSMLQELARSLPVGAPFKGEPAELAAGLRALATRPGLFEVTPAEAPSDPDSPQADAAGEKRLEPADEMIPFPVKAGPAPAFFESEEEPLSFDRFKAEFTAAVEHMRALLTAVEQTGDPRVALALLARQFRIILGAAGLLRLERVARLAAEAGELVEYVADGQTPYSPVVTNLLLSACGQLLAGVDHLELTGDGRAWRIDPAAWPPENFEALLEDLWAARQGFLPAGQQPAGQQPDEPPAASKSGAPEEVAAALREQKSGEAASAAAGRLAGNHTVKVETLKLDGLIDMVGELVIAQSLIVSNESLKNLREQKLVKDLAQVSRITSELQRNAMSLRMVQIRGAFQKMNRLVRDLAHKFAKEVDFATHGDDTEIDRNMVESIYDPLVHLVRNALDHGLEPAEARLAAGKPARGHVALRAYHQGGNVVIELTDDGPGLNREKVLKKALEKGLITQGETLSDAAIHNLVFQPGFSTAEKVSDISGRGVGMDVVKKAIDALRGKVDFTSTPGRGSVTTIRLPLTLAIIDGMIVRVGEHRYILPTISINQSFRPEPSDYFTVKNQGEMIRVRGELLPLVRLDHLLEADGALSDPAEALVVVVENEGERRCLLVDEVVGKQEVVIKSLGEGLKYVKALAGGTILGDGRVGLILDVGGLFESAGGGRFLRGGMVSAAPGSGASGDGDWGMGARET